MAGYVDTQIAAYRKTVGDAIAGKGLQQAIRQLQERSKVRDSLKDLPARGAITSKRKIGRRGGALNLTTEIRTLKSSDGIFEMQYEHILGVS